MIDLDRTVLYVGIASVLAVAAFNHLHANATPSPLAGIEQSVGANKITVAHPPRGPWTTAGTASSPLR